MVGVLLLLRRRWLLALAGLLLIIAACVNVAANVQPSYRATSQMLFLLPPENPDPTEPPVNPYLNLQDGMGTTANLIAGMVTTKDVQQELESRGLTAEYTVVYLSQTGPILQVDATDADPQVAARTRNAVMDLVDADLATLQQQAGTPPNQLMTATRPTVSKDPIVLYKGVYTALGMTAVTGFLLVLLLCFVVDRLVRRRSRRGTRARRALALTTARATSRLGHGRRPAVAQEEAVPAFASLPRSSDQPVGPVHEAVPEHPAGEGVDGADHVEDVPDDVDADDVDVEDVDVEDVDVEDVDVEDVDDVLPPPDRGGSGDEEGSGARTAEVSGRAGRDPGRSHRYRDRMARRGRRTDVTEVDLDEGSDHARPRSMAG